jgi:hypothetical protein
VRLCPESAKRCFYSCADALAEFDRLVAEGRLDPMRGSIYTCTSCEAWHISSRRFVVARQKGRGKRRRGIVDNFYREEGA